MDLLRALLDDLPDDLSRQVFTHASWTDRSSDSYERLAFLGDSVLGLAITAHLYPRLEAERYGAGRLTKIRAQTVSGSACRQVAERLGVPDRMRAVAPEGQGHSAVALETERVLSSVTEAVIGACYLTAGYERTVEAVVEAFAPETRGRADDPSTSSPRCRSALPSGARSSRTRSVPSTVRRTSGVRGDRARSTTPWWAPAAGRTKKHAEQEAARAALEQLDGTGAVHAAGE